MPTTQTPTDAAADGKPTPDDKPTPEPKPAATGKADAKPAGKRGPGRPRWQDELTRKLTENLETVTSMALVPAAATGNLGPGTVGQDVLIVQQHAPALAAALVKVAETNPAMRRTLERLVATSAWGELLAVVAAIGLGIAQNHNALPWLTEDATPAAA